MTTLEGSDWSPVEERVDDVVSAARVAALHGLLDAPGDPPPLGAPLPLLWHWLAFLPTASQAALGVDGHPRRGGFLPPVTLPRRMFVGGRLSAATEGGLTVGEPLRRRGIVSGVRSTSGRSGELVFVTVDYQVTGTAGMVGERQDLVYRPAPPSSPAPASPSPASASHAAPPPANPGPDDPTWVWGIDLAVEPTLLFRFSALTYNAHRIHYDRRWATEVEGYPGLVVHGPLQAVGLAELCRRYAPERRLCEFEFRAVSPAFDDGPLRLRGRPGEDEGSVALEAFDHRGATTMTATGSLA